MEWQAIWSAGDDRQEALLREFYRKWPMEAKAMVDFERAMINVGIKARELELATARGYLALATQYKTKALDAVRSTRGTGKETPQVRKRPRV